MLNSLNNMSWNTLVDYIMRIIIICNMIFSCSFFENTAEPANLGQAFGTRLRNLGKLDRTRKVWYLLLYVFLTATAKVEFAEGKLDRTRKVWSLLLRVFWLLLPKLNLRKGNWALGYVSTQIWDFPNISLFLKSFGNSYTKFAILDITFRLTCG